MLLFLVSWTVLFSAPMSSASLAMDGEKIRRMFESGHSLTLPDPRMGEKEDQRRTSFRGETLKVGLFHFPPFTFEEEGPGGEKHFRGVEVSLARVVAESLGMRLHFQTPLDGKNWGSVKKNGSSSGLIHDVIHGIVDVGMAEFFNKPSKNGFADPSEFYTFDHYCFVRAKPQPQPQWQKFIRPFSLAVWLAVLASLLASSVYLSMLAYLTSVIEMRHVGLMSLSFFVMQGIELNIR